MDDAYLTIKKPSTGIYRDKGSRFLAFAYPVSGEEEIKEILESLRKEYHDARHHCYAWRLGQDKILFRANDDGEPASSAGKPILGQIQSFDLTNVLIVVVRYFGGILLGVGGLIQAYRTAAREAILSGEIITAYVHRHLRVHFNYDDMNHIMKTVKDHDLETREHHFESTCSLLIIVRQSMAENISARLSEAKSCRIEDEGIR
ncbi:MAG: YigZ family protein [Bacteroidota bacterium]